MEQIRKAFERWWELKYHNGNPPRFGWEHWRNGDGYQSDDDDSELDGLWSAWQASRQAVEIELPSERELHQKICSECASEGLDIVEKHIRAAGLRIKGE